MEYSGKPVRVTTVIGRFKESGGLIYWAWDQGRQGRDYRAEAAKAADIGTVAHGIIQRVNRNTPDADIVAYVDHELPAEGRAKAFQAAESFLLWKRGIKLTILDEEVEVFDPDLNVVGHVDAVGIQPIGRKRKALVILDWKSTNKLHTEMLIQIAAYKHLYEHQFNKPVVGAHLVRFSKDSSDFEHHWFDDLQEPWDQFLRFRDSYEVDKRLRKRL